MNFKDFVATDMDTFMNTEEFADTRKVNGKEMVIIIDDEELAKRKSSASNPTDGVYNAALLFYVRKSYFDSKPVPEQVMRFDKTVYRITDVQEDDVMYTILLERNAS